MTNFGLFTVNLVRKICWKLKLEMLKKHWKRMELSQTDMFTNSMASKLFSSSPNMEQLKSIPQNLLLNLLNQPKTQLCQVTLINYNQNITFCLAIVDTIGSIFSSGTKEKSEDDESKDEENANDQSSETPSAPTDSDSVNKTSTDEASKPDDSKQNETEPKPPTNGTETVEATKNATKPPSIKPPPKFIRTKLTLDTEQKYPFLSSKQITESTRVLGEFERAERAKRDLEAASNALESLVYDTAVKLDEEWLQRKDFVEDFQAIKKEVDELKVWIEDEAFNADVTTLRKKRDKLSGMIRSVHLKEKKREEAKLKVIIN